MDSIKLNFINNSSDAGQSQIVIFQNSVAEYNKENVIAWRVLKSGGKGSSQQFIFPLQMEINARDHHGNHTPKMNAVPGQLFHMTRTESGHELSLKGDATIPSEVQLHNDLEKGAISANIFRDSKLLAFKPDIDPGQKSAFEFMPKIFVGVAPGAVEGEVINLDIILSINAEFSLFGIASADIIMADNHDRYSKEENPYEFYMENVAKV